jgi:hypothetical protein
MGTSMHCSNVQSSCPTRLLVWKHRDNLSLTGTLSDGALESALLSTVLYHMLRATIDT